MRLIDDPSIYPVVTTDLNGNILYIRTYGLHHYGYVDFIMEENFENYEAIFDFLIEEVLALSFDYGKEWFQDGRHFRTVIEKDNLADIRDLENDKVRTLIINHPTTNEPMRYQSHGLKSLYQHPEFHINSSLADAYDLIGYFISKVKSGFHYDEDYVITYDNNNFELIRNVDRYGNDIFEVIKGV